MLVRFADASLDKVETGPSDGTFSQAVVTAFRRRMQLIRAADSTQTFYAMKSLHFEKLRGNRAGQHSMRLNDQWRLIVEIAGSTVVICGIEDYH
jgi:toxin HigB-1